MKGNIRIKEDDLSNVFLYAHNTGHSLPMSLRSALQKRERWDDTQYLSRIIFCQILIDNDGSLYGTSGFGISALPHDGKDRILVVDTLRQRVSARIDGEKTFRYSWTFDEFCGIEDMRQSMPSWGIPRGYEEWFANDNQ